MEPVFSYIHTDGPIDYFHGTMDKEELIECWYLPYSGSDKEKTLERNRFADEVEAMTAFIREWVQRDSGEQPYEIRFFAIPNFAQCRVSGK